MTTDCFDTPTRPGPLHDAILAFAVVVIFVVPAALGLGLLF